MYTNSVLLKLITIRLFTGDAGRHSDGGIFSNSEFGLRLENKQMFIPSALPLPGIILILCVSVTVYMCVCVSVCVCVCVVCSIYISFKNRYIQLDLASLL